MAGITCTPASLMAVSECFECGLTHKQILSSILYVLCTVNNMSCTPSSLANASECFRCAMNEKQILAAILYSLCSGGSGGAGQIVAYTLANPNVEGVKPANLQAPAIAVKPAAATYTWSISAQTWQ